MTWQKMTKCVLFRGSTLKGTKHPNHDTWGSRGNIAWVIDGATPSPLLPKGLHGSPADFSILLSKAIDSVAHHQHAPLADLLHVALTSVQSSSLSKIFSATVAMVRVVENGGVEWLLLGDAMIVFAGESGATMMTDNRLSRVAVQERKAYQAKPIAGTNAANPRQKKKTHSALVAEEDRWRNQIGGFWVASDNPEAAYQAFTGTTFSSRADGDKMRYVALATDGIADAYRKSPINADHVSSWDSVGPGGTLDNLARGLPTSRDDMTLAIAKIPSWVLSSGTNLYRGVGRDSSEFQYNVNSSLSITSNVTSS